MISFVFWATLATAPCDWVELRAQVSPDHQTVRGEVVCQGSKGPTSAAIYPAVLREPKAIDDVNRFWLYPQSFEAAWMEVTDSTGKVQRPEERWIDVAGATGHLRLRFETHIPERNGTFGRRGDLLYLLGGWHPAFGNADQLARVPIRYEVTLPPGVGFVGDQPVGSTTPRKVKGTFRGRYLPIILAPQARVRTLGDTVLLQPLEQRRPSRGGEPPWDLQDISAGRDDVADTRLLRTLQTADRFARRLGIPTPPLVVVRTPLRERLVEVFDGGIAISDRAFHLVNVERFLKFHRLPVWRALLFARVLPLTRGRQDSLSPEIVADAIASALRDRLARERYGGKETAADLLNRFAVIPEIDALVFAPQTPFVDAYYEAIDEEPALRRRLTDFYHRRPRGKLLFEKLQDLIGFSAAQEAADVYLGSRLSWSESARHAGATTIEDALPVWLGPYPRLDYVLEGSRTVGASIEVDVGVRGPDADSVVEPITVEIEDDDGKIHRAQRMGPGTLSFEAPGPPDRVEVDPDRRLVERAPPPGRLPRYNNRDPKRWRFLLNNIAGLIAVTNRELTASADFSLRQVQDLRLRFDLVGLYSPTTPGAAVIGSYAFGQEITPLRLGHRVGGGMAYTRLRGEAAAAAGNQISGSVFYRYDDRLSPYWAYEGRGLSMRVTGGQNFVSGGGGEPFVQFGASAFQIIPFNFRHALLLRAGGDFLYGSTPIQTGFSLGGRDRGARGYERDEARGTRRIIGSAEYRHAWVTDGRTDLMGLATWTRLDGALFADVIHVPVNRPGCRTDVFYDVGYGVRFIGDILGLSPSSIQLDIGIPLNRCDDESDRTPVSIYLAFIQSFTSF